MLKSSSPTVRFALGGFAVIVAANIAAADPIPMTFEDFHLSGTQIGDIPPGNFFDSQNCSACHGNFDSANEPYFTWKGSLMGNAGRDPLFFAQMTTANQDVANVGYFCMRCHVPMSFVTGHAYQPDGSTLNSSDRDGVSCHFCHAMVDPIYQAGVSPPADLAILNALDDVPDYYGNAMFVLDPTGTRRGPYTDATPMHTFYPSPFFRSSDMCGTCHDVGNVALTRQPNGTYSYNALNQQTPDENLHTQFPLERTYTEWKLSQFANGGVDMGGRFGGQGVTTVSSCQDCHMPKTTAQGCFFGPTRTDLSRHDFAGASSWVLDIIALNYADDPNVNLAALAAGSAKAVDMVQRSATIEVNQACGVLHVRVVNETGHKLPTGHIEGRRVWINVQFLDETDALIGEYGEYDMAEAELHESSTRVYEMKIGLSPAASAATGLPAGETTHMSLADTIVKDSRIPPRGFNNAAYAEAGAPVVATTYADGQYWDDAYFNIPPGTVSANATVYYQTVTRHYIEALREGNTTDQWGNILHSLWERTNKGAPVPITSGHADVGAFTAGDFDCDDDVDDADLAQFVNVLLGNTTTPHIRALADLNHDGQSNGADVGPMIIAVLGQ